MVAAVCLSVYWFWVIVKLVRLGRKIGKDPNALPREKVGILMRVGWYPCIAGLLIGLWGEVGGVSGGLFGRLWVVSGWVWAAAGLVCVALTGLTFVCWRKMGRSWRIGIDPNETLALVSTGPYRYVRHPIYALRMVIDACACILVPTPLVLVTCGIDCLLLQIEARREERYMEAKHGAVYARYKKSVGRFVPRRFVG